jgi:hypothetical protein
MFSIAQLTASGQSGVTGEGVLQHAALVKKNTCGTMIRRLKVVALLVRVPRRRLWLVKSQIVLYMVSGVIGQNGPNAVRSVVQDVVTVLGRSRCMQSLVESHVLVQRKRRKTARTSHALLLAKCLIGRTLVNAPSVAEVEK